MKLIASDCFKSFSLTDIEFEKSPWFNHINNSSIINFKYCDEIREYILSIRKINREFEEAIRDINLEKDKIREMINGGHIQTIRRTSRNNIFKQQLIVLKNKLYYLMEIGGVEDCSMGTMIFDESNYNWQDVSVRETPNKEKYKVHQMKIIDVSSDFDKLNFKMTGNKQSNFPI